MMPLKHDGTLIWTGMVAQDAGRIRGTIELPVDLFDEQSDPIDRIFAFAFDALGLQSDYARLAGRAVLVYFGSVF